MSNFIWTKDEGTFIDLEQVASIYKTIINEKQMTAIVFKNNSNTYYFVETLFDEIAIIFTPNLRHIRE